ncbi:MAG: sulfatase-like hydrolase/transferase [Chloroflexi bacterium]|nr:sulfatase-like hydrolase/transferase [Chloroflexota bacterium]
MSKPNILVIFNDDHAQWALGAYGNHEIRSPTIDYLAETGVQMENAFTPIPICSPSRACFLTGRLPSQHGVHDFLEFSDREVSGRQWLKDEITLAQRLSAEGYQTALVGKWHLGADTQPQAGFEHWFSLGGKYPINRNGPYPYSDNGQVREMSGYKTTVIADESVNFLRNRDQTRPFFLMVALRATHSPWADHPERSTSGYRNCAFADIPADAMYPFGRQRLSSILPTRLTPHEALAQYYASVSRLDEATGRLIDELEALDLRREHARCSTRPITVYAVDIMGFGVKKYNAAIQHGRGVDTHSADLPTSRGVCSADRSGSSLSTISICTRPSWSTRGSRRPDVGYPGRSLLPLLDNSRARQDWRTDQFEVNLRIIRTRHPQVDPAISRMVLVSCSTWKQIHEKPRTCSRTRRLDPWCGSHIPPGRPLWEVRRIRSRVACGCVNCLTTIQPEAWRVEGDPAKSGRIK